ncbi:dihydrolipoamide succinyltransferase [Acidihalobacter aeolianus]|uniref:Dihydrolipoyllysine-residue succinyltransferase component of 2-oxoglutarate dehydrogenase complex n=1 Tax=Acidihalobacter aeolianus TaxID=2792603 RepID=A0A1D8K403_9GAMM|nr:2-oxoglutarate dehydrogenase complex dihydrolipoyllysine-residue succinyltransferase [Acidihalobacter aeolianus]AOV15689.1 dihydrolipoamide succinyltransferase [Acidihalobacter aeolianus]
MRIEVKIPPLPESVADATLAAWHKQPGEPISADDNLADLETDKVVLELPAPGSGVLGEILIPAGSTVTAGQVIARIETSGADTTQAPAPTASAATDNAGEAAPAGPAARQLMMANDIQAGQIAGSGRNGRILKEDVLAYLAAAQKPAAVAESATVPEEAAAEQPASPAPLTGERAERRVPMTRLRARIAERLLAAQRETAMLTTFNEVDMQPVNELRQRYRDAFEKAHGVRLGLMSFFVTAAVAALKRFPAVNASIDGDDIVYHSYYDVGIAVSSPRGLVVPILRDADRLGAAGIERGIADFAARAKDNTLGLEEITGGTFTITNGGVFGSLLSTPILNPPQSAILGMHKVQDRPVVVDGQIVVRPMMYLALSYDHRIIDGREAVQCLATIKAVLEDPARLLLDV